MRGQDDRERLRRSAPSTGPAVGEPILRVAGLGVDFNVDRRVDDGVAGRRRSTSTRRGAGRRGRVRLRQVGVGDVDPGPAAEERARHRQRDAARRGADRAGEPALRAVRGKDIAHGLPGADDRAEPGAHGRLSGHRGAAQPLRPHAAGRARAGRRADEAGRAARPEAPVRPVPAPALRRPAAARR